MEELKGSASRVISSSMFQPSRSAAEHPVDTPVYVCVCVRECARVRANAGARARLCVFSGGASQGHVHARAEYTHACRQASKKASRMEVLWILPT